MSRSTLSDQTQATLTPFESKGEGKLPEAPKNRLKDAVKLRAIHSSLVIADEASERNRAKVQDLKDFKPPLDQQQLNARGQGSRFNINFGETASILNEAQSPYIDAFVSPEHIIGVKLKRNMLDPDDKSRYERVMSDEFTKMVRSWDSGLFSYLTLVDQFVTQGVGVAYFDDPITWQWRSAGLREFKFPRRTRASSDSVELLTCEDQREPSKLSDIISDEKAATMLGWNVPAVKQALGYSSDELYDQESYEDMQEKTKSNDTGNDDSSIYKPINLILCWVKEHDGKVSFYMCAKNDVTKEGQAKMESKDFMFKSDRLYDSMEEALQLFPFFTGNKGNLYSIRGLGYMVYPQAMASNLMQCALLDSAKDSMSVKYISPTEKALAQIPIVQAGPATLIPPSLVIAENQKAPDLTRAAMPALDILGAQMNKKSVSSTMSGVFSDAPDRRSKFELSAALEHFNSLNNSAMLLFSAPWRSTLVQSVKRAFDLTQNPHSDAGKMAKRMHRACMERGVPKEVLKLIDFHETKSGVPAGPGGKAARAAQFESATTLYTSMDDTGRKAFDRDRMVDIVGPERAATYLNLEDAPRETVDHTLARLENNDLREGTAMEPSGSENFSIHLRIHIGMMEEVIEGVERGETDLVDATQEIYEAFVHASKTLDIAVVPEQIIPELQQHTQSLQQIGEYLNNGIRQIEKESREQQEAGGEGEGEGEGQEFDAEAQRKQMDMQFQAETHLEKLRQGAESHDQTMAIQRAKAAQDLAITDAKASRSV